MAAAHQAGLRPPAPGEGSGTQTGPLVAAAAGARDDVPDRARLSAHRRVRRLVRPHAHRARLLPGSLRAAERARARTDVRCHSSQRWRLLATFNSGFIYSDGSNGSRSTALRNEPLKDGLATLIGVPRRPRSTSRTGRGGPDAGPEVAFARQSLPLIVDHGRLQPRPERQPAMGLHTRERSPSLAHRSRDRPARNLIYAAADYQTVTTLAEILQRAGAVQGDGTRHQPRVADPDHLHATSTASCRRRSSPTISSRRPAISFPTIATSSPSIAASRADHGSAEVINAAAVVIGAIAIAFAAATTSDTNSTVHVPVFRFVDASRRSKERPIYSIPCRNNGDVLPHHASTEVPRVVAWRHTPTALYDPRPVVSRRRWGDHRVPQALPCRCTLTRLSNTSHCAGIDRLVAQP